MFNPCYWLKTISLIKIMRCKFYTGIFLLGSQTFASELWVWKCSQNMARFWVKNCCHSLIKKLLNVTILWTAVMINITNARIVLWNEVMHLCFSSIKKTSVNTPCHFDYISEVLINHIRPKHYSGIWWSLYWANLTKVCSIIPYVIVHWKHINNNNVNNFSLVNLCVTNLSALNTFGNWQWSSTLCYWKYSIKWKAEKKCTLKLCASHFVMKGKHRPIYNASISECLTPCK